jgi:hypothetical protein
VLSSPLAAAAVRTYAPKLTLAAPRARASAADIDVLPLPIRPDKQMTTGFTGLESIGISKALGKAWGGHGTRVRARMRRLRQHGVSGLGADALAWVGFGRPVTLHKGGSLPRPRG